MSSASIGGQMVRSPSAQALDQAIRKDVQPKIKDSSEDSKGLGSKVANFMDKHADTFLCILGVLGWLLAIGVTWAPLIAGIVIGSTPLFVIGLVTSIICLLAGACIGLLRNP